MNKTFLVAASLGGIAIALPMTAHGQGLTGAVYACAELTSDTERLACYDAAVVRLRSAEEAGEIATVTADEVVAAKKESFGLGEASAAVVADEKLKTSPRAADLKIENLEAGITAISRSRSGELVVTLDNGQVWQQIDTSSIRVSLKAPPKTAKVKKAALGSYLMKVGRSPLFRVRRVE